MKPGPGAVRAARAVLLDEFTPDTGGLPALAEIIAEQTACDVMAEALKRAEKALERVHVDGGCEDCDGCEDCAKACPLLTSIDKALRRYREGR